MRQKKKKTTDNGRRRKWGDGGGEGCHPWFNDREGKKGPPLPAWKEKKHITSSRGRGEGGKKEGASEGEGREKRYSGSKKTKSVGGGGKCSVPGRAAEEEGFNLGGGGRTSKTGAGCREGERGGNQ